MLKTPALGNVQYFVNVTGLNLLELIRKEILQNIQKDVCKQWGISHYSVHQEEPLAQAPTDTVRNVFSAMVTRVTRQQIPEMEGCLLRGYMEKEGDSITS